MPNDMRILILISFFLVGCDRLLDSETGGWDVQESKSPLDDSPSATMSLQANQGGLRLQVRCLRGEFDVIVSHPLRVLGRTGWDWVYVSHRFDQEPAETDGWLIDTTGRAVFAPPPYSFAGAINRSRQLYVRVEPEVGPRTDGTFQLKGSEEAMQPLREACGQ